MNTEEIIEQIDGEISKLQQAKGLLLGTYSPIKKSPGRPRGCHQTRYMREPLAYLASGDGC